MKYPIIIEKLNNQFNIKVYDYPAITVNNASYINGVSELTNILEDQTWLDSTKQDLIKPTTLNALPPLNGQNSYYSEVEIADRYQELPPTIYYYLPASEILFNMLSTPYIWFSNPSTFNDPFELPKVRINEWTAKEEWYEFESTFNTLKNKLDIFKGFKKANDAFIYLKINAPLKLKEILNLKLASFEKALEETKVACFSRSNSNTLMWSHYSKKHTGAVIGYDSSKILDSSNGIVGSDIDYRKFPRGLKASEISGYLDKLIKSPYNEIKLFTKHPSWSYEKEFRIIKLGDEGIHNITPDAITKIYFGCKMDKYTRDTLLALIKGLETNIKVFEMIIEDNKLKEKKV